MSYQTSDIDLESPTVGYSNFGEMDHSDKKGERDDYTATFVVLLVLFGIPGMMGAWLASDPGGIGTVLGFFLGALMNMVTVVVFLVTVLG